MPRLARAPAPGCSVWRLPSPSPRHSGGAIFPSCFPPVTLAETTDHAPQLHCRARARRETGVPRSERVRVGFAGPDAHRVIDRRNEDFAITDLTGLRRSTDDLDHPVRPGFVDRDFDPDLRQEVHRVLGTAVNLGM